MLALSTVTIALVLAPWGSPHTASPATPRAAVSAIFGVDTETDLRKAAIATLASVVLIASPTAAFAKGGGHGGGGHASSHSSYSHSSSSSSSSPATRSLHSYSRYASPKAASVGRSSLGQGRRGSTSSSRRGRNGYSSFSSSQSSASSAVALAPPPPPTLLFPSESVARQEGGYYCPAEPPLPKAGEKLTTGGRKATVLSSTPQVALYGSQLQTVPGLGADCSVTVQYDDNGTTETLSAAEKAQPLWLKHLDLELLGALYGGNILMFELEPSLWDREKKRHDDMVKELTTSFVAPVGSCPKSGEYWGSSDESDDGDQAVRSWITFEPTGAVRGHGTDGEDGPYKITKGAWGKRTTDKENEVTVGWIEEYEEGFQVVVEGFYDTNTGKIEARFRSSRGVSGRFMLGPKPSIF